MASLSHKNVLIGVTGGIAAYKVTYLVRLLIKQQARVKVIMTPDAKHFVTPLTLSTLSKNTVNSDFIDADNNWINHVEYAKWGDIFIIAPLTANTLSKLATGLCDNLVIATYLSCTCDTFIAPAMDLDMYQHPTTKTNLNTVKKHGVHIIPAESGELASGLAGEGRMAEPENIIAQMDRFFQKQSSLKNKHVLITAGPTYEPIDPVRFIGNHSSGKMGFALAETALALGAKVTLISGPTSLRLTHQNLNLKSVKSAEEMRKCAVQHFPQADIGIAAAAVADYQPKHKANQKIKKKDNALTIELKPTPDILAELGQLKKNQILVGFALETEQELENARKKLDKKNLDFIVLNSLNDKGAGFSHGTNKISIIDKTKETTFALKNKTDVASDIFQYLIENYEVV